MKDKNKKDKKDDTKIIKLIDFICDVDEKEKDKNLFDDIFANIQFKTNKQIIDKFSKNKIKELEEELKKKLKEKYSNPYINLENNNKVYEEMTTAMVIYSKILSAIEQEEKREEKYKEEKYKLYHSNGDLIYEFNYSPTIINIVGKAIAFNKQFAKEFLNTDDYNEETVEFLNESINKVRRVKYDDIKGRLKELENKVSEVVNKAKKLKQYQNGHYKLISNFKFYDKYLDFAEQDDKMGPYIHSIIKKYNKSQEGKIEKGTLIKDILEHNKNEEVVKLEDKLTNLKEKTRNYQDEYSKQSNQKKHRFSPAYLTDVVESHLLFLEEAEPEFIETIINDIKKVVQSLPKSSPYIKDFNEIMGSSSLDGSSSLEDIIATIDKLELDELKKKEMEKEIKDALNNIKTDVEKVYLPQWFKDAGITKKDIMLLEKDTNFVEDTKNFIKGEKLLPKQKTNDNLEEIIKNIEEQEKIEDTKKIVIDEIVRKIDNLKEDKDAEEKEDRGNKYKSLQEGVEDILSNEVSGLISGQMHKSDSMVIGIEQMDGYPKEENLREEKERFRKAKLAEIDNEIQMLIEDNLVPIATNKAGRMDIIKAARSIAKKA